jgi:hypothetical protein
MLLLPHLAYAQPLPAPCRGPLDLADGDAFIACAHAGTEKYRDQSVAILDGYRRIGRDFPGMGEHWIRVSLVFDGRLDPARPEVLNYININGAPQLVGVAYAIPLLPGEHPPAGPAGPDGWHEHSRTLDDETLLPRHMHGDANTGARLSMLHAWIWSPNPGGMFAADNWALPFLRLQLTAPADATPAAGKALALASGAREYFELAIGEAARLSTEDRRQVATVLDRAQKEVETIAQQLKRDGGDRSATATLANVWTQLWADIEGAVSAEARPKLTLLPIR